MYAFGGLNFFTKLWTAKRKTIVESLWHTLKKNIRIKKTAGDEWSLFQGFKDVSELIYEV